MTEKIQIQSQSDKQDAQAVSFSLLFSLDFNNNGETKVKVTVDTATCGWEQRRGQKWKLTEPIIFVMLYELIKSRK